MQNFWGSYSFEYGLMPWRCGGRYEQACSYTDVAKFVSDLTNHAWVKYVLGLMTWTSVYRSDDSHVEFIRLSHQSILPHTESIP